MKIDDSGTYGSMLTLLMPADIHVNISCISFYSRNLVE